MRIRRHPSAAAAGKKARNPAAVLQETLQRREAVNAPSCRRLAGMLMPEFVHGRKNKSAKPQIAVQLLRILQMHRPPLPRFVLFIGKAGMQQCIDRIVSLRSAPVRSVCRRLRIAQVKTQRQFLLFGNSGHCCAPAGCASVRPSRAAPIAVAKTPFFGISKRMPYISPTATSM